MGYGTTIMSIVIFVNLVIFLGAFATDKPEITSPVINILISVYNGDVTQLIPSISSYIGNYASIIGLIIFVIVGLSYATGQTPLLSGGGYGATQTPMLIGVFIFTLLFLLPNFHAMGFPSLSDPTNTYPLAEVIYAIFGLMLVTGLYGIIRGE